MFGTANKEAPVTPRIDGELENRIQVGTAQAIAFAIANTEKIASDNAKILQHLPGFLNAAASIPALANLIKAYRDEAGDIQSISQSLAAGVKGLQDVAENNRREAAASVSELANLVRTYRDEMSKIQSVTEEVKHLRELADNNRSEIAALRQALETRNRDGEDLWQAATRTNAEIGNLWKSAEQATSEIGKLWQRVDFTRAEILFEMMHGSSTGATAQLDKAVAAPRIVNDTLMKSAPSDGLKINIGCGHVAKTGYVNVDSRALPGVDVVADLGALPFEDGSLSEIFSAHVLEHYPEERLKRTLPYWRSLLKKGGEFRAIVPDGEAMLAEIAKGRYSFEDFRSVLFGGQEYHGDFHYNMFTPDSLSVLLKAAGFTKVSVEQKGRKNGNCFEFEIVAHA